MYELSHYRREGKESMSKRSLPTCCRSWLLLATCFLSLAPAPGADDKQQENQGSRHPVEFSLRDLSGRWRSIDQLAGPRATIIAFLSTECPMSNSYLEPLSKLASASEARGVRV